MGMGGGSIRSESGRAINSVRRYTPECPGIPQGQGKAPPRGAYPRKCGMPVKLPGPIPDGDGIFRSCAGKAPTRPAWLRSMAMMMFGPWPRPISTLTLGPDRAVQAPPSDSKAAAAMQPPMCRNPRMTGSGPQPGRHTPDHFEDVSAAAGSSIPHLLSVRVEEAGQPDAGDPCIVQIDDAPVEAMKGDVAAVPGPRPAARGYRAIP